MPKKNTDKRFTKDHEWVMLDGDIATVGITEHAQEQLGELVFIELPALQREVAANEACAVVESVKAASDVYAPVAGTVVEVNKALEANPEKVNQSPYGDGWMLKLKLTHPADASALLSPEDYGKLTT